MGWFWADSTPTPSGAGASSQQPPKHPANKDGPTPPPGCPMHTATIDAFSVNTPKKPADTAAPPSSCPVPHQPSAAAAPSSCPIPHQSAPEPPQKKSLLSQLNPLNYMFPDLSQEPAPNQTYKLPTSREESSIPRSDGDSKWEYPSPQQMYNALLRKGYADTDITAVEDMVSVHNFLNEGAWEEVVGWEKRFAGGLMKGWEACRRGEENSHEQLAAIPEASQTEPTLIRFQGRPKDMTPKAAFLQMMARIYPSKFEMEAPFDRHDWYVARNVNGHTKEVRYVIDYYSAPPEVTGEPVFYLDVRPALTPTGAAERIIRWGGDVWWRASGGVVREAPPKTE